MNNFLQISAIFVFVSIQTISCDDAENFRKVLDDLFKGNSNFIEKMLTYYNSKNFQDFNPLFFKESDKLNIYNRVKVYKALFDIMHTSNHLNTDMGVVFGAKIKNVEIKIQKIRREICSKYQLGVPCDPAFDEMLMLIDNMRENFPENVERIIWNEVCIQNTVTMNYIYFNGIDMNAYRGRRLLQEQSSTRAEGHFILELVDDLDDGDIVVNQFRLKNNYFLEYISTDDKSSYRGRQYVFLQATPANETIHILTMQGSDGDNKFRILNKESTESLNYPDSNVYFVDVCEEEFEL